MKIPAPFHRRRVEFVVLRALVLATLAAVTSCAASPGRAPAAGPSSVVPRPGLAVTRFVAFGDSLTEAPTVKAGASYPAVLQGLLTARYPRQAIVVSNRGSGGESADKGLERLPAVLETDKPQVVLLMEGTNNLPDREEGIRRAGDALAAMVRLCKAAGARVLLATVPPQVAGAKRGTFAEYVPALNDQIRRTAAEQGVVLVDVNAAIGSDASLLDPDGLHLSEAGCRTIARTFLAAIRREFETH